MFTFQPLISLEFDHVRQVSRMHGTVAEDITIRGCRGYDPSNPQKVGILRSHFVPFMDKSNAS